MCVQFEFGNSSPAMPINRHDIIRVSRLTDQPTRNAIKYQMKQSHIVLIYMCVETLRTNVPNFHPMCIAKFVPKFIHVRELVTIFMKAAQPKFPLTNADKN